MRLSKRVDLQQMAGQFGAAEDTARKLLRMSGIPFLPATFSRYRPETDESQPAI
ncbi:hypothetical protein [Alishewanella longhuensis]